MSIDERTAYVALALTPGIGAARLSTLLTACSTALGALSAPFEFLRSLPGFSRAAVSAISAASIQNAEQALVVLEQLGGRTLLPADAEFPDLLRLIPDPPTLLFAKGDLTLLARPAVAIVGSRDHSAYGGEACALLASGAAQSGLVVVSGMARGLDAEAHRAVLEAGGFTIGILGNGLGVIYPAANRLLYQQVEQTGLLLTEFAPGERPNAGSFQRRNRLISGLAKVTVVVEAGVGSGALITADTALAQGREVMAVPGPITSLVSVGANRLIRDGAAPLLELDDLLAHYPEVKAVKPKPSRMVPAAEPPPPPATLSAPERLVYSALRETPRHVDDLAAALRWPVGELLGVLCAMELAQMVEQRPGSLFLRI